MIIESRQAELDSLYNKYAGGPIKVLSEVIDKSGWTQADQDLCLKIARSKQGEKFKKLFKGQFDDYKSQSEADLALCSFLAFWSGKNAGQMDRIFRKSKLYRLKWDEMHGEQTYCHMTIQKAIAGTANIYETKASTEEVTADGWLSKALVNASVERFIGKPPPMLDWIFEGSLLARTVGALVGPGGVGKSTLVMILLIMMATGRDILTGIFRTSRAGKVLAIFAEEDETVLHHRFKGLVDGLFPSDDEARQLLKENMFTIPAAGHDLRLMTSEHTGESATAFFREVLEVVESIPDLRLIVIDPLSRFFGGGENDNGAGTYFVSLLENIAQATGAAVIVCHHVGKRSSLNGGKFDLDAAMHQDSSRGASAITNGVRWQCNLVGLPEKAAKKHCHVANANPGQFLALQVSKKNYGKPEPTCFLERQQGGVLKPYLVPIGNNDFDLDDVILELISEAIRMANRDSKNLTRRMMLDAYISTWKKNDDRITRAAVDRAITTHLLKGVLQEITGKNASGRRTTYLSLLPQKEDRTGGEPEAFEPEEPDGTGKIKFPVLN